VEAAGFVLHGFEAQEGGHDEVLERRHPPREETPATETGSTPPPPPPKVRTVTVPVPLRKDGTQATVELPIDVTEREVKKVAQIIELYAMTEQLSITTGESAE
jgi:hypothetical protein